MPSCSGPAPFPRLGVFPTHIFRVVEVQQQAFTAVEEAAAQNVVIEERESRADNDVYEAEAHGPFGYGHLRAQRRVAIHVVEIAVERGIGVMKEMVLQFCGRAVQANVFMYQSVFELTPAAAEEPQLGIGIKAAVANPAAEEEVLARDKEACNGRILGNSSPDLVGQRGLDLFIGIKREHPVASGF